MRSLGPSAIFGATLGLATPAVADSVTVSWPAMSVDAINATSGVWLDRKFYSAIQGAASSSYGHVYRQMYTGGSNCEWVALDAGDGWVYLLDRNNYQFLIAKSNGDMSHGDGANLDEAKWQLQKKKTTTISSGHVTTSTSSWVRFANKKFGTFLRAKDDESYRNVAWQEAEGWEFYDPFSGDWLDGGMVFFVSTRREAHSSNGQTYTEPYVRYVQIDTSTDDDWPTGTTGLVYESTDSLDAATKDAPDGYIIEPVTEQAIWDYWPASTGVAGLVRFKAASGKFLWPSTGDFVRADGPTGSYWTAWAVFANTDGTHSLRAWANGFNGLRCAFDGFGLSGRAAYMCNNRNSDAEKIYVLRKL